MARIVSAADWNTVPSAIPAIRRAMSTSSRLKPPDDGGGGAGFVTVTAELPTRPPLVAEIITLPAATPVTTPLAETVAIAALPVDQATA